ncbi:MAG TPA: aldo/keto reductase [Thermoleophilia bacterium]|nr:aldo/keto reductase [Thermoleophilia bacterium]
MALTSISDTVTLNDGVAMPRLGLGVWRAASGHETRQAVLWALETGYRHVDTARIYGNERDVGAALRASAVPRDQVFVTTKLWNRDQGYERAKKALATSLRDLGLDYVDLYLEHWPVEGKRLDSWRALQELRADGYARSIGVSNFQEQHVAELLAAADVVPSVNQVEFTPFLYQRGLLEACRAAGIQVEAYSPLTRGRRLDEPALVEIAARHAKTPAQVLIRWSLQHDLVVIPKSVRLARLRENADVFDFELSPDQMERLDALHEDHREAWDPTDVP